MPITCRVAAALALLFVAAPAAAGPFDGSEGAVVIYGWETGKGKTTVGGAAPLERTLYPVVTDIEGAFDEVYVGVATDWIGQLIFSALPESVYADPNHYAKDEATINLKLGQFQIDRSFHNVGVGFDLETRTHTYQGPTGGPKDKVRVGIGPNLAIRTGTKWIWTVPNVSVTYFPWPNEAYEFIPKGKAGWGWRVEVPIYIDLLASIWKVQGWNRPMIALKPFYGFSSGFYSKDEQTGQIWTAESRSRGVRVAIGIGL